MSAAAPHASAPVDPATRERSRVALVTCAQFPDLWDDDVLLLDALRGRGADARPVVWDDPRADWAAYGLVVVRSPWDYPARRDEFVAWAHRVPRLANPADVLRWNTDKHYLRELAAAGVPVTPTTYVEPGDRWTPPASGQWVVKPAVSAASQDTGRYELPEQAGLAAAHVGRLTGAGRTAMIQPYLTAVDTAGETAVLCLPDDTGALTVSHAVRKGPMLTGPDAGPIDIGEREVITSRTASEAELALAAQVLAAIPGGARRLLYARVDMIPGPDGAPMLVELELAEPSLFFGEGPGSAERLADAILARLQARSPGLSHGSPAPGSAGLP